MAAALLTAGAMLTTACSNEDDAAIENATPSVGSETIQFTATLAPKGDDGTTTRAITTGKDANNKEILNVAWKAGEQIAIYYETASGQATTTATVESVDSETGEATITATFAADAKDDGDASFVYPATLHNGTGDIDESILLTGQNGLLRTGTTNISKNFDAATKTGKISVTGGTASVKGTVAMENRVCICKIALTLNNGTTTSSGTEEAGTTLTIAVGDGHTYTVSSPFAADVQPTTGPTVYRGFKTGDVLYVAMLPFTSQSIIFASTTNGGTLYGNATTGTLAAGKFYRNVPVTITASVALTESTGNMTLHNGVILTGTGGTSTHVTIDDGATIMLLNATIPGRAVDNASDTWWAGITCSGDANIILAGGSANSVKGYHCDFPGIIVPSGKTLTILGNGSLTATSGTNTTHGYGAGIGGRANETCGNIMIEGGTIIATGGNAGGAGIGGGYHGNCGNITISGGSVTATKGNTYAYSIGKGQGSSTCGTITIGGTVYYDGTSFLNSGETYLATSPFTWPTP